MHIEVGCLEDARAILGLVERVVLELAAIDPEAHAHNGHYPLCDRDIGIPAHAVEELAWVIPNVSLHL